MELEGGERLRGRNAFCVFRGRGLVCGGCDWQSVSRYEAQPVAGQRMTTVGEREHWERRGEGDRAVSRCCMHALTLACSDAFRSRRSIRSLDLCTLYSVALMLLLFFLCRSNAGSKAQGHDAGRVQGWRLQAGRRAQGSRAFRAAVCACVRWDRLSERTRHYMAAWHAWHGEHDTAPASVHRTLQEISCRWPNVLVSN